MANLSIVNNVWEVVPDIAKDKILSTSSNYLDRNIVVKSVKSADTAGTLIASNIKSGVTILGVTGTLSAEGHSSYTPSSTYFTTSTAASNSISAAKVEADKYTANNYYIKKGSLGNASGTNVTLSEVDNGISVKSTAGTSGWIDAGDSGLKYISGVTLNAPTSGTRSFAITVPNGDAGMITFTFNVDNANNVWVD